MARYQLRRPSPVRIIPRRVRRQEPTASTTPSAVAEKEEEEEEEEEGPESPDSLFSSPSTVGALSEGEDSDSDSEDEGVEPPSPAKNGTSATATIAPGAPSTTAFSLPASIASDSSETRISVLQNTTADVTSQVQPQVTSAESALGSTTQPPVTSSTLLQTSRISTEQPAATSSIPPPPPQLETSGENSAPQQSFPQSEPAHMTKGTIVAVTFVSILGALTLIIGTIAFIKRRKRKQRAYHQRLGDDAFNPGNTGSLHAPETAHVDPSSSLFNLANNNIDSSHMTRSTDRSNTLFGPASYSRPETVSTERGNNSRIPPTPNPFADPPLNKAYDVLAGRPRSTTLTDRGSWIKNPFRNPESERFDPFGELQEKARNERTRHMEEVRREAEVMRLREEREKEFAAKERMGLVPDGLPMRKGSGVTVEGLGVLDRSGGPADR